mmetsp:Transcript_19789/g.51919  ORF Transcript_19789/g.51919 Transcript_19789/m.51919 type:complete len:301 (-) Transcript_19789:1663-2565(-)
MPRVRPLELLEHGVVLLLRSLPLGLALVVDDLKLILDLVLLLLQRVLALVLEGVGALLELLDLVQALLKVGLRQQDQLVHRGGLVGEALASLRQLPLQVVDLALVLAVRIPVRAAVLPEPVMHEPLRELARGVTAAARLLGPDVGGHHSPALAGAEQQVRVDRQRQRVDAVGMQSHVGERPDGLAVREGPGEHAHGPQLRPREKHAQRGRQAHARVAGGSAVGLDVPPAGGLLAADDAEAAFWAYARHDQLATEVVDDTRVVGALRHVLQGPLLRLRLQVPAVDGAVWGRAAGEQQAVVF